MTTNTRPPDREAESRAAERPLLDALRSVPEDARGEYHEGEWSTRFIPYGRMCKEAAARIGVLEYQLRQSEAVLQGERTKHLNFVLDLDRVVKGEPTLCSFEDIEAVVGIEARARAIALEEAAGVCEKCSFDVCAAVIRGLKEPM